MGLDFLAFASNFSHFSGPNNPLLDLGNHLHAAGRYRFAVLTHRATPEPEFAGLISFPVHSELRGAPSWGMPRLLAAPANVAVIRKALRRLRPRRVIVFSSIDTAFEVSWAIRRRVAIGHNVLFNAPHRDWHRRLGLGTPKPTLRERLVLATLDRIAAVTIVDLILAHTEFHKRLYLTLGIPAERITVVPHCIDSNRVRRAAADAPASAAAGGLMTLLYAGRLEREKGVSELLEAASHASREVPLRLIIVGRGRLQPVVERAEAATSVGGTLRVEYQPWAPRPVLMGMMRDADAVVIPSYVEAFGMVGLEAMALGRPVIGVTQGGLPEIVRDGKEGIMVESPSPPLLASAILSLARDEGLRKAFGANGERRVAEQYDVAVVAPKFVQFMESLG